MLPSKFFRYPPIRTIDDLRDHRRSNPATLKEERPVIGTGPWLVRSFLTAAFRIVHVAEAGPSYSLAETSLGCSAPGDERLEPCNHLMHLHIRWLDVAELLPEFRRDLRTKYRLPVLRKNAPMARR